MNSTIFNAAREKDGSSAMIFVKAANGVGNLRAQSLDEATPRRRRTPATKFIVSRFRPAEKV
jgi:hypothetical protein